MTNHYKAPSTPVESIRITKEKNPRCGPIRHTRFQPHNIKIYISKKKKFNKITSNNEDSEN